MDVPPEVLTEEEKESIISAAKGQYKESIKSRRVEAVLVNGALFSGKAPFFSGWASGTTGHWGLVVDGLLHHFIFKVNDDGKPIGVEFDRGDFKERWIDQGKVTAKEEIGSTSLPLAAIKGCTEIARPLLIFLSKLFVMLNVKLSPRLLSKMSLPILSWLSH
jgi:hypothetical protein